VTYDSLRILEWGIWAIGTNLTAKSDCELNSLESDFLCFELHVLQHQCLGVLPARFPPLVSQATGNLDSKLCDLG